MFSDQHDPIRYCAFPMEENPDLPLDTFPRFSQEVVGQLPHKSRVSQCPARASFLFLVSLWRIPAEQLRLAY
jgi:hypothetical protein